MSEHVGRSGDPHLAVKREVLVRYLDVWAAAVLRSHRGATYVESGDPTDAFEVFAEFADRLDGNHLEVVVVGPVPGEPPAGLVVRSVASLEDVTAHGPMLAHLDGDVPAEQVVSLAQGKAHEVLLTLSSADRLAEYRDLAYTVTVELVADDGRVQLLVFATGDTKHLANFKNELWAADEFAGIRYRDPHDAEHSLVDISLTPQLLPLRRQLLAELARQGSCTVADLQRHTLLRTIYRPADAIGALTSAASAGAITREPAKGRLTPRTVVGCP